MTGLASGLLAMALGDADMHTACGGTFRHEYAITPDGGVRINYPAAPPFPEPTPDHEPTIHDLRADIADQWNNLDREAAP